MKILFVAPCYYTNQEQFIKKLLEKKHEISFHVAYIGPTEDQSLIKPVQFKQCKLSLFFKSFIKGGVNQYYFPAPYSDWRAFKKQKPDIIIIRHPYKLFSMMAAIYALLTKTCIVIHTLGPSSRFRIWKTRLK